MLLKMLLSIGIKEVALAGFDGYSLSKGSNYVKGDMEYHFTKKMAKAINEDVIEAIAVMAEQGLKAQFVTKSQYDKGL
jgi:4-hydroxy 2-oxovalerate aldolase